MWLLITAQRRNHTERTVHMDYRYVASTSIGSFNCWRRQMKHDISMAKSVLLDCVGLRPKFQFWLQSCCMERGITQLSLQIIGKLRVEIFGAEQTKFQHRASSIILRLFWALPPSMYGRFSVRTTDCARPSRFLRHNQTLLYKMQYT